MRGGRPRLSASSFFTVATTIAAMTATASRAARRRVERGMGDACVRVAFVGLKAGGRLGEGGGLGQK